jgi:hypothetical protein
MLHRVEARQQLGHRHARSLPPDDDLALPREHRSRATSSAAEESRTAALFPHRETLVDFSVSDIASRGSRPVWGSVWRILLVDRASTPSKAAIPEGMTALLNAGFRGTP